MKTKNIKIFVALLMLAALIMPAASHAADGDLNAAGIVLRDTNANGKIDEVQITVDYAAGTANGIAHATDLATTIGKFAVTDTTTANPVTVSSIEFVSGNGTVAVFKLVLSEADADLSVNTSATALNIVYDAVNSDLKITNGTTPVAVAAIASGAVEKDGAAPVAMSAVYKDIDSDGKVDRVDVTYSESVAGSVFTASEWSLPTNPHALIISSGTFSTKDVQVVVTGAPAGNTAIGDTTVKYTAGTGITDGVNKAATSAVLSAGDKARPIILSAIDQSTNSLDGGVNIPANANMTINFSEPMDVPSLDVASEFTVTPDPATWAAPVWSNSNKTVVLSHTTAFTAGSVETVTLTAPLAVSGVLAGDKALISAPIAAAVSNPFSFTVAGAVADTVVSASVSTVVASPVSPVVGQNSTVTVTAKNSAGAVLAGKVITITSSRATDTLTTVTGTTGANGVATFTVSSTVVGASVITAKAGDLTLTQAPTINFVAAGTVPPAGACAGPATPNYHSGVTLFRIPGDHRVYVIKNKKKQWIKTAEEFNANCYDWSKIQAATAAILAKYPDAQPLVDELIRAIGDSKVYAIKGGKKQWIRTAEEFNAAGYDWNAIKTVTPDTLASFTDEQLADALVKIVNAINLRVRSSSTSASAVLDTVKKDEVYTVIEKKGGWYKIKTKKGKEGWVSGNYTKEEHRQNGKDDDDED